MFHFPFGRRYPHGFVASVQMIVVERINQVADDNSDSTNFYHLLPVTVGSRIHEFQCRIKHILTRSSNDTQVNFIGKKSTEVASIHSDFQGIFPLNFPEVVFDFQSVVPLKVIALHP